MATGCVTFCGEIRFKERKNGYIQKVTVAGSNFRVGKTAGNSVGRFATFREKISAKRYKKKCRKATI